MITEKDAYQLADNLRAAIHQYEKDNIRSCDDAHPTMGVYHEKGHLPDSIVRQVNAHRMIISGWLELGPTGFEWHVAAPVRTIMVFYGVLLPEDQS